MFASVRESRRSDGTTSFAVLWRDPGSGGQTSQSCDNESDAIVAKQLTAVVSEHIDLMNALAADKHSFHRPRLGLAAIGSDISTDDPVLFGGTAPSRTHLADALSADIDLTARIPRRGIDEQIERARPDPVIGPLLVRRDEPAALNQTGAAYVSQVAYWEVTPR